jgi:tripeptide aminopeptidase
VIGFVGHLDTTPEVSGKDVKPQIHWNYDGGEIVLPGSGDKLSPKEYPQLAKYKGQDVITSDGTTLLGADDKGG